MTQPDTSPKAVADTLRYVVDRLRRGYSAEEAVTLTALADALERQAGVTWEERVEKAALAMWEYDGGLTLRDGPSQYEDEAAIAIRAAFPEYYAPTESESDD